LNIYLKKLLQDYFLLTLFLLYSLCLWPFLGISPNPALKHFKHFWNFLVLVDIDLLEATDFDFLVLLTSDGCFTVVGDIGGVIASVIIVVRGNTVEGTDGIGAFGAAAVLSLGLALLDYV